MHGIAHKLDAILPAILVAANGGHARLKSVANEALREERILARRRGSELLELVNGKFVPANSGLLQSEIEGGVLVGRQRHASARIAAKSGNFGRQRIISGRHLFHAVTPLAVGQHDEPHSRFDVLRLDKHSLNRRAVRPLHGSGDGRGVAGRSAHNYRTDQRQYRCQKLGMFSQWNLRTD